jgi:L-serine/L-threonine ammonia-lyase
MDRPSQRTAGDEGTGVITFGTMNNTLLHIPTPLIDSMPLRALTGKTVHLKMECCQPAGSFKIRGIGHLCRDAVASGITHLVSSSGGNAGYAVAFAGRRLGVSVTVIVPETTPESVRKRIESEGAAVRVHGRVWDEAHTHALAFCEKINGAYIPPFDHPVIWKGHATLVDELATQCAPPDAVILSVGGGGLLCGVVEGLRNNGWNDVPVIAVETEGAASLAASVAAGKLVTIDSIDTIATTLGARRIAAKAFEWTGRHPITSVTVTDTAAVRAARAFADDHRVLVEPACGASLSLIYDRADVIKNARSVVVIVCGGIGVTIDALAEWERLGSQ